MEIKTNTVKIIKNFLTGDDCERLIKEHQCGANYFADVYGEKKYRYSNPEESQFLDGIEILLKLEIDNYIEENRINDFPNFKAGDFKLMEYQKGDWFIEHYDGDFSKWPEGGFKYHPFTTNIALNSWHEYRGGELSCNGKALKMCVGDLVIFPSSYSFPHGVTMVTEGNRYVMVSEPYSLDWGLQNKVIHREIKCEEVDGKRESLFSRSLRFLRKD